MSSALETVKVESTMEFSEKINEDEAIELHIAGELSNKDPKLLLKSVGMLGAENIICESLLAAKGKGDFSKVRRSIGKVFSDFHEMKSATINQELESATKRVRFLEAKYDPPEDERSWNILGYVVIFLAGLFIGLMMYGSAA